MDQELRDERNRRWDEPFGKEPLDRETVDRVLALPAFADVNPADFPSWLPVASVIANDGRIRTFQRAKLSCARVTMEVRCSSFCPDPCSA